MVRQVGSTYAASLIVSPGGEPDWDRSLVGMGKVQQLKPLLNAFPDLKDVLTGVGRPDHQELRPWGALDGAVGGDHETAPGMEWYLGSLAAIASSSSRAATCGRLRAARSASGTAIACNGGPCSFGWYNNGVSVTLSATDNQGGSGVASIRYTTDGSDPTNSSAVYTNAFTISGKGSHTVKAKAAESGYTDSDIATASFIIK